jgi:hypothetical protein
VQLGLIIVVGVCWQVGPALEARPSAPDVPRAVTDVKEVSLMGIGAYGKVSLVRYKGEQYALKAIMKKVHKSMFGGLGDGLHTRRSRALAALSIRSSESWPTIDEA